MNDQPTSITPEDIDNFVNMIMSSEIKKQTCFSCGKECFCSYGYLLGECEECYFKNGPKIKE